MSNEKKTIDELLAEKRAAKEAKLAAREEKGKHLELEKLELEERFEAELGPRGQEFEIVDVSMYGDGFIVVKLNGPAVHKQFQSAMARLKKDQAPPVADLDAFVTKCLAHPAEDEYRKIVAKRPDVAAACVLALNALYGGRAKSDEGKS